MIASIALGVLATRIVQRLAPPDARAAWLTAAGRPAAAERVYWDEIQKGRIDVPTVVAFVEAHRRASTHGKLAEAVATSDLKAPRLPEEPALPDSVVDEFLGRVDLPREVSLIGRYVRFGDDAEDGALRAELVDEASKDPPLPWANHVLAREAWSLGELRIAADRYEREALAHGRDDDLARSLELRMLAEDWSGVEARLADPRIGPRAPSRIHFRLAAHHRDWARAVPHLLPYAFPKPSTGPLILAAIACLAWFWFCARLGQLRERPALRVPLYLAALALGVLSIAPTVFLIEWQTAVLHLVPTGEVVRDAAFFVLGVGFREELSKLLLFLPLLPFLRRYGTPVDVVACGALVGLGFAAAENVDYFARGDLTAALGRFLTANFLHMSMTAIAATAASRIGKKPDAFYDFTVAFLTVVVLHGVYDFFLAGPLAESLAYFAMMVLVVLAQRFILIMHDARLRVGRSKPLLPVFAIGIAVVTGASYVYASVIVGPTTAAEVMYLGLLGVGILVIVFVKQLRRL